MGSTVPRKQALGVIPECVRYLIAGDQSQLWARPYCLLSDVDFVEGNLELFWPQLWRTDNYCSYVCTVVKWRLQSFIARGGGKEIMHMKLVCLYELDLSKELIVGSLI